MQMIESLTTCPNSEHAACTSASVVHQVRLFKQTTPLFILACGIAVKDRQVAVWPGVGQSNLLDTLLDTTTNRKPQDLSNNFLLSG